jgi:hypothetical protein
LGKVAGELTKTKKFQNIKGTFALNNLWIVKHIEAIILDDSGSWFTIGVKNQQRSLKIEKSLFLEHFQEVGEPTDEDMYEFESDKNKRKKNEVIQLIRKHLPEKSWSVFESALKKAHYDAFNAAGNQKTISIQAYEQYLKSGKSPGGLKGHGDPVLNRAPRWTPVADEGEWVKSGDPAPVGIRESDHARLRNCNQIYLELVGQIFSMNHDYVIADEFSNYVGFAVIPGTHRCWYCGGGVDVSAFEEQTYAAKEHPINFCHRDPSDSASRTRPGNIYFGHTSCNRTQGGLSELERIRDGLRLLKLHPEQYSHDTQVQEYLSAIRFQK